MSRNIDLSERTVLVTGGGRNIGREIALAFAERGADVAVSARTQSEIDETVELVEDHGVSGLAIQADLTDSGDIDAMIEAAFDEFGTVETLVNNAGVNPDQVEKEGLQTMVDVNLTAVYEVSEAFYAAFEDSGADSGSVVNISSIAGRVGVAGFHPMYCGTKAGVYGLTRGLAARFADGNVTVNSITPGLVDIPRNRDFIDEVGEAVFQLDQIPLDKLTTPEHVADACLYLGSDLSEDVTGEDVVVDGGVHFTAGLYTVR